MAVGSFDLLMVCVFFTRSELHSYSSREEMRRCPQETFDFHVRDLTEMRQLSLELSYWEVGRFFHMLQHESLCLNRDRQRSIDFTYVLVQVPCFLASKFHVCFKLSSTTSELRVRQNMWTSNAVCMLLYIIPNVGPFLLALFRKSFCDARQSDLLDQILPNFLRNNLTSLEEVTGRAEGLPFQ